MNNIYNKLVKNKKLISKFDNMSGKTINNLFESDYTNKIISYVETDPLEKRIDLKKIYSISNDEYFDILEYEVSLINSLQGEIFDTSDPKWNGTGNYEFEFEIDKAHITTHPKDEYILFKGDAIGIDVDIDVHGTVFLESTMIDNPGREWTISEAINNRNIGYIIISEIRDIVYTILEQRLPMLINLGTLNVCDVKEGWVTRLSNEDKGNVNEGIYDSGKDRGDGEDFLEYVYKDLVENTKWRDASFSKIDLFGDCRSINVMISWGSVAPYFIGMPDCVEEKLINLYGLSWKEIDKIWDKYEKHIINMILSKKRGIAPHIKRLGLDYLNESVDNKFLDKVVNNLIRETKPTSEKHVSVITPFMFGDNDWILTAHRCREIGITHSENYMIPKIITDHLRGVYSLQSIEEMEYVMGKYYFNIYNKYFRKFFDNTVRGKISESEDLEHNKSYWEKENQFFVKIVNQIMRETVIGYKNNKIKFPIIKFPFDKMKLEIGPLDIKNINIIFDSNISNISGDFANNFYRHCRDVYGLKYNEIKRLWSLYSVELVKHILKVYNKWEDYHRSDQGTMGTLLPESYTKGDNIEFLNKMVDFVIDTTELIELDEHPYIRIKYPFINYGDKVPHLWYEAVPRSPFIVNMVDDYGIRKAGEADFILDKYSEKLRDKVKTKLP